MKPGPSAGGVEYLTFSSSLARKKQADGEVRRQKTRKEEEKVEKKKAEKAEKELMRSRKTQKSTTGADTSVAPLVAEAKPPDL